MSKKINIRTRSCCVPSSSAPNRCWCGSMLLKGGVCLKGHQIKEDNMEYTKGEWEVVEVPNGINQLPRLEIMAFQDNYERNICRLSVRAPEEESANAHLIAAAVNGCASVNPDNPMAVAQSIEDLCEALEYIIRELDKAGIIKGDSIFMVMPNKALAKAKGG